MRKPPLFHQHILLQHRRELPQAMRCHYQAHTVHRFDMAYLRAIEQSHRIHIDRCQKCNVRFYRECSDMTFPQGRRPRLNMSPSNRDPLNQVHHKTYHLDSSGGCIRRSHYYRRPPHDSRPLPHRLLASRHSHRPHRIDLQVCKGFHRHNWFQLV